jgi:phosphoglycolate phosphatase-like HAD superfamily hydrolase
MMIEKRRRFPAAFSGGFLKMTKREKEYQAVLFDFDYTLGDATDAIVAGFQYAMGKMGHPVPDRETVRRTVGYRLQDAYTLLTGDEDQERRLEFRDLFREVAMPLELEDTPLFPGAVEVLTNLHDAGVKVGIVSTKRTDMLDRVLVDHGVSDLLTLVVGGDQVTLPKPDPQGINDAVAALGVDKSAVLYCGDTVLDAGAAQRAGVDFAAVLNGTTTAEAFDAFPFVTIASDLMELNRWLDLGGKPE